MDAEKLSKKYHNKHHNFVVSNQIYRIQTTTVSTATASTTTSSNDVS